MEHDHHHGAEQNLVRLGWALGLTATVLIVEVIGGVLSNSLALLTDAAHMATDTLGLLIALLATRLSTLPADAKRSFGYARMEAIGALGNGCLLLAVAGYILWEAAQRVFDPPAIASQGMLAVAVLGLVVNLIAMRLLSGGREESLNVRGAYLEVWSDMIGSIGVLIGAIIIMLTDWLIVDPILAILIGLWVLPRAWKLASEALHVLMEGVPSDLDLDALRTWMQSQPQVVDVHELHAWSLGTQQRALTAHIVANEDADIHHLRKHFVKELRERYRIQEATLQMELQPCDHTH